MLPLYTAWSLSVKNVHRYHKHVPAGLLATERPSFEQVFQEIVSQISVPYRGFHMNAPTGETPVPLFSETALITVFR
jgi:hypothetical protein